MSWLRSRRRALVDEQEGATAAAFVVSFFMLLSVGLLAIDGGFLWLSQRGQVADTDSAALAAARQLLDEPCSTQPQVDAAAGALVTANDAATTIRGQVNVGRAASACDVNATTVVTTERRAPSIFAGALGFGPVDTAVKSHAQIVAPTSIKGVVPVALCESDEHVEEWKIFVEDIRNGNVGDVDARADAIADYNAAASGPDHPTSSDAGDAYTGARTPVHRMQWGANFASQDGDPENDCDLNVPGNFGWVDFPGTSNGNGCGDDGGLCEHARNGYEPGVSLGMPGSPATYDCDAADATLDECRGAPGLRPPVRSELVNNWLCPPAEDTFLDCPSMFVVLYDSGNDLGGNNAEYNFTGVAAVVLRDFVIVNANEGWMDVELIDPQYTGPGTKVPTGYTGPLGVVLCGAGDFHNCNQSPTP